MLFIHHFDPKLIHTRVEEQRIFITPSNEVLGSILVSPCLSVCLSVRPSVSDCLSVCLSAMSVDTILSTHILRDGCMDFSEKLYTDYSPSVNVHLEFSY